MVHDKKVLGVCGETSLANSKQSIITMMQVYEYYISHHLAKAFESLFGSVTCLPGCFTMYRLRTPDTHKPLFIANAVIGDYSENRVDTLHMKNLLHLGEDRYLTTLLLKHFPNYKTQFVRDAKAFTVAPDEWRILLSQRRRWINSTIHNLGELVFLDRLCGFCCFSMRFVVMIDLLSTVIQPVTVAYVGPMSENDSRTILTHCFIDYLPHLPLCGRAQGDTDAFDYYDSRCVWCSSLGLRPTTQMGYDRMDVLLHPRYPGLLVLPPSLLLLAYGRLLMGSNPCGAR